jgi:hypothetical protein
MVAGDLGQRGSINGSQVRHRIELHVAPDIFHGIEFGGVGWKEKCMELTPILNKHLNLFRPMGQQTIPDHNHWPFHLFQQITQKIHYQHGVDVGICMEAEEQMEPPAVWGHAQGCDHRNLFMGARPLIQHGGMSSRPPRPSHQRGHQHTSFVDEDKKGFQTGGFFLIRGHCCLIHCWICSSSRSMARRWGFCGLQPSIWRKRPT